MPESIESTDKLWRKREDQVSWFALKIREAWISKLKNAGAEFTLAY